MSINQDTRLGDDARITVAAVVPGRLQDAVTVLLRAGSDFELVACTVSVEALLSLQRGQAPNVVLLHTTRDDLYACHQVKRIKAKLSPARCLVLVEQSNNQAAIMAAGADRVLLTGVSPARLLEAIYELALMKGDSARRDSAAQADPNP